MYEDWEELEKQCKNCTQCKLCSARKNVVIGDGNKNAEIMFIGEGPGADEDAQGIPFVGRAGQLMNNAFKGVGIKREDVYIANIVKCRPPQNRDPEQEEIKQCITYIKAQINLIKPKKIVLLGSIALKAILGEEYKITQVRGSKIEKEGITYYPTYHPVALLRDETKKIQFWQDLKNLY